MVINHGKLSGEFLSMTESDVLQLGINSMEVAVMIAMPLLGVTLVLGLIVSVFQAATQINEMTLSFIPKLIGLVLSIVFFGPWILDVIVVYTKELIMNIPHMT